MFGITADVFIVILLTAWTVKEADERGRSLIGWALVCLAAGAAASTTGLLLAREITAGDLTGDRTVLALVPIILFPIAAMTAVAVYVGRLEPVAHVRRGVAVRRIGARGGDDADGVLRVGPEDVRLELGGAPAEDLADARASVDGECVRLAWTAAGAEREALLLPLGRPNTPAGRRKQSETLVFMIRSRKR